MVGMQGCFAARVPLSLLKVNKEILFFYKSATDSLCMHANLLYNFEIHANLLVTHTGSMIENK